LIFLLYIYIKSYNEACHAYGKSLKINPLNKAAIAAQCNIYIIQGKLNDAENLLKVSLNRITCYKLRTLYAKVLVAMTKYTDAIEQLHLSISLNPEESKFHSFLILFYYI
jgi:predicted Zn-dependent protease